MEDIEKNEKEAKKELVEKRVKKTVIRRRVKTVALAPEKKEEIKVLSQSSQEVVEKNPPVKSEIVPSVVKKATKPKHIRADEIKETPVQAGEVPIVISEKEEKAVAKGPKRRKSRAEMELEDIRRAGGLLQYAKELTEGGEEVPVEAPEPEVVERVFEPKLGSRRKKIGRKEFKKTQITEPKTIKKTIRMEEAISVSELSQTMGIRVSDIIKKLMGLGTMVTANQMLDVETATLIATDFGYEVVHTAFQEDSILEEMKKEEKKENLKPRAPVVTVMGHVDHGKTSLLDAIRKTNVTAGEAGGITQHIGAYEVTTSKGNITFIDTPGHQAFTHMRARGAQVTDIVVLVVAADDGIMPQTIEAINHARAANAPIIVAINKMDTPQANIEKVKRSLSEQNLLPEDWGGETICVPTSAKKKEGIDTLLEMILLTAEMKELKANPDTLAKGTIIESKMDKGRGPVATVLIQNGTLKAGQSIVAGLTSGRVRAMRLADGREVQEAPPSTPVEVLGLEGVPQVGEQFFAVEKERDARKIAETRENKRRAKLGGKTAKVSLEELQKQLSEGEKKELPLLIKADVVGSLEAVSESVQKLSTDKVSVKVLHGATGGISENDVMLAAASSAVIVGFNVVPDGKARQAAEQEGIEIRTYSIIYELLDEIKKAMEGLLSPTIREKFLGSAKVKEAFTISKVGTIAGCQVTEGVIRRSASIRLVRDGTLIHQGKISSLKRFKDDAREVNSGQECGIGIENFDDIKPGDDIEAFLLESIATKL